MIFKMLKNLHKQCTVKNKHLKYSNVLNLLARWPKFSTNTSNLEYVALLICFELVRCSVNVPHFTWKLIYYQV